MERGSGREPKLLIFCFIYWGIRECYLKLAGQETKVKYIIKNFKILDMR